MPILSNYLVEPVPIALQVLIALVPLVALTCISVRIGRRLPWAIVPWAIVALLVALDVGIQWEYLVSNAATAPSLIASTLARGFWNGAALAVLVFSVMLAVIGPKLAPHAVAKP